MYSQVNKLEIGEVRKRKKLTQKDVADHFGVSLTTYNGWENNFGKLPVTKAKEIIDYLSDKTLTLDDIIF